ncbi:MAG: hypothetical protein HQL24_05945 [Candidatus Omnitrophica bacterium]|nr:hypothetical protein [Candidatus Omnitrophota bacterium]
MKKMFMVFALLIFMAAASTAYAHPPSDIKITFNPSTKILTAAIIHNTSNPSKHYINKVDVGLNGKDIITQMISKEDNNASQTVSYLIPDAKAGDILSVEGHCSISGALKKEISVAMGQ